MKNLGFAKRFLLLFAHVSVGSVLAEAAVITALPSHAASLGSSQATLDFSNFSQSPLSTPTSTLPLGEVVEAGSASSGLVTNEVQPVGNFFVEAGESLSFDFQANFALTTSVDNLTTETANAQEAVGFFLVDSVTPSTIYDSFIVYGNLTTPGTNDVINLRKSDNVKFGGSSSTDFEGTQEAASISGNGSLNRSFTDPTSLTLVQVGGDSSSIPVSTATNTLGSIPTPIGVIQPGAAPSSIPVPTATNTLASIPIPETFIEAGANSSSVPIPTAANTLGSIPIPETFIEAGASSSSVPVPEATNTLASILFLGFIGLKYKLRKK